MSPYLPPDDRKTVVFLGTPAVVLPVLHQLLRAERFLKVVAVVTQPPARSTRGGAASVSPVHEAALAAGVPVLHPESARDEAFLADLRTLAPDLCVTAAYGNVLPQAFLDIPKHGTVNVHPSLLPLYRGAAPVQRALEEGVAETGVSLALTVLAMDAGPILHQEIFPVPLEMQAPRLLAELFELGALRLLQVLPDYFNGSLQSRAQDDAAATKAKKIRPEEGWLSPEAPLRKLHDKVRAFAAWPGTRLRLKVDSEALDLKILETNLVVETERSLGKATLSCESGRLLLRNPLSPGLALELLQVQAPGKKACMGRDFWNGIARKSVALCRPESAEPPSSK